MRKLLVLVGGITLLFWISCKRRETFTVPPEIGRGLPQADSLRALLDWLEGQSDYAADTLQLYTLYIIS